MAENEKTDIKEIQTEEHQKPDGILTKKINGKTFVTEIYFATQSSKWTHFLNIFLWKDRITPAFPCKTVLFHPECNLQVKSAGVLSCIDLCIQSSIGVVHPGCGKIYG